MRRTYRKSTPEINGKKQNEKCEPHAPDLGQVLLQKVKRKTITNKRNASCIG
jgi:hypothetical protein